MQVCHVYRNHIGAIPAMDIELNLSSVHVIRTGQDTLVKLGVHMLSYIL